jgi:hypothetical protein
MNAIIHKTLALLPGVSATPRAQPSDTNKGGQSVRAVQPPKVLANLPQVDMVDIRALFRKWED